MAAAEHRGAEMPGGGANGQPNFPAATEVRRVEDGLYMDYIVVNCDE